MMFVFGKVLLPILSQLDVPQDPFKVDYNLRWGTLTSLTTPLISLTTLFLLFYQPPSLSPITPDMGILWPEANVASPLEVKIETGASIHAVCAI